MHTYRSAPPLAGWAAIQRGNIVEPVTRPAQMKNVLPPSGFSL
jgi:hypothetical protein